jgi:hypothetical protein
MDRGKQWTTAAQTVSRPRFEPGNSRIWSRNANHLSSVANKRKSQLQISWLCSFLQSTVLVVTDGQTWWCPVCWKTVCVQSEDGLKFCSVLIRHGHYSAFTYILLIIIIWILHSGTGSWCCGLSLLCDPVRCCLAPVVTLQQAALAVWWQPGVDVTVEWLAPHSEGPRLKSQPRNWPSKGVSGFSQSP